MANVLVGLGVTATLAVLCLKVPPIRFIFAAAQTPVEAIAAATSAGTSFVFGYLGGAPLPFEPNVPGSEFIFAFQVLPIILVDERAHHTAVLLAFRPSSGGFPGCWSAPCA